MSEKKPIDRIFQEGFKDFEATPDTAVWEKIKTQQKKDRKIVLPPFWYRIAGVAAIIAIAIMIASRTTTSDNSPVETLVLQKSTQKIEKEVKQPAPNKIVIKKQVVDQITEVEKIETEKIIANQNTNQANTKNLKIKRSVKNTITRSDSNVISKSIVVKTSNSNTEETFKHIKESIATHHANLPTIASGIQVNEIQALSSSKNDFNKSTSIPVKTEEMKLTNSTSAKKSLYDVIDETSTINKEKTLGKKWAIMPTIAPVFYNTLNSGSSIATAYIDNEKTTEANFSYGVQIAYRINERIQLRGGLHKLNVSYATQDVGLSQSIAPNAFNKTFLARNEIKLVDLSPQDQASNDELIANSVDILNNEFNSDLNQKGIARQRIGYIELPLEMTYALVNNRFGMHMIGGVSTLFLNDNDNTLTFNADNGDNTALGKSENLNSLSFSGNLGIGFQYKIMEHFQVHIEPIFKYQVNAYNETTEFEPYTFGMYTGLSFQF